MNEYTEPISFVPMKSKNNTSLGAKDMSVFHDITSATYEQKADVYNTISKQY